MKFMIKNTQVIKNLHRDLMKKSDPAKVNLYKRYFKCGVGEYAEGDQFLGVNVPSMHEVARLYKDLDLETIKKILKSRYHEERMVALQILVNQFTKSNPIQRKLIFNLYLKNTKYINNWDLVDTSAPKIVGKYLEDKKRNILYKLAKSKSLWEKRIAIIATLYFIKIDDYSDTLKISEILLFDKHDLIHKAVGWALREVGKRNKNEEEKFLKKYYSKMPRTMLRYAIEKYPEDLRKKYLLGKI